MIPIKQQLDSMYPKSAMKEEVFQNLTEGRKVTARYMGPAVVVERIDKYKVLVKLSRKCFAHLPELTMTKQQLTLSSYGD